MEEHTIRLKSYLWMHDEARLTEKQYLRIAQWTKNIQEELKDAPSKAQ